MAEQCWYPLRPVRSLKEWKTLEGRVTEYDHSKATFVTRRCRTRTKPKYQSLRMSLQEYHRKHQPTEELTPCSKTPSNYNLRRTFSGNKQHTKLRLPSQIQVFVRTLTNSTLCLQINNREPIEKLKNTVANKIGLSGKNFELFTGKSFKLCPLLSAIDNGIDNEDNIDVVLVDGLLGGADNQDVEDSTFSKDKLSTDLHTAKVGIETRIINSSIYIASDCTNAQKCYANDASKTAVTSRTKPYGDEDAICLQIKAEIVSSDLTNTEESKQMMKKLVDECYNLQAFAENNQLCERLRKLCQQYGGILDHIKVWSNWFKCCVWFNNQNNLEKIWRKYKCGTLAEQLSKAFGLKKLRQQAASNLKLDVIISEEKYMKGLDILNKAQLPYNLTNWTEDHVVRWLLGIGIPETIANAFREEAVTGRTLAIYKEDDLFQDFKEHGLKKGHFRTILHHREKYVQALQNTSSKRERKHEIPAAHTWPIKGTTIMSDNAEYFQQGARPKQFQSGKGVSNETEHREIQYDQSQTEKDSISLTHHSDQVTYSSQTKTKQSKSIGNEDEQRDDLLLDKSQPKEDTPCQSHQRHRAIDLKNVKLSSSQTRHNYKSASDKREEHNETERPRVIDLECINLSSQQPGKRQNTCPVGKDEHRENDLLFDKPQSGNDSISQSQQPSGVLESGPVDLISLQTRRKNRKHRGKNSSFGKLQTEKSTTSQSNHPSYKVSSEPLTPLTSPMNNLENSLSPRAAEEMPTKIKCKVTKTPAKSKPQGVNKNEIRLRKLLFGDDEEQQCFDKGYYPVLVANKPPQDLLGKANPEKDSQLSFVQDVDWKVVFDLYADSKTDGLCNDFETKRKPVLQLSEMWNDMRMADKEPCTLEQTLWLFCNGRVDDPNMEVRPPMKLHEWNDTRSRDVENAITHFSQPDVIPGDRAVIIFLILSENDIDILSDIFRKFSSAFQGVTNITCIVENEKLYALWVQEVQKWCSEDKLNSRSLVGVPLTDVNIYIRRMVKVIQTKPFLLPNETGGHCQLNEQDKSGWKDLEVLCSNECEYTDMNEDNPDFENFRKQKELDFFRGHMVDWWNFILTEKTSQNPKGYNHVLRRNIHESLRWKVEMALRNDGKKGAINPVVTVTIFHQPGSGATTLGRHILWDFHRKYRCLVVNRITANTVAQILDVYNYGYRSKDQRPKPILLLVEFDNFELFRLVSHLENVSREKKITFCVILHCSRIGDPDSYIENMDTEDRSRAVSLKHELHESERNWFQLKYEELEHRSVDDLDRPENLIGFMVLKEEFNEEYLHRIVSEVLATLEQTSNKEYWLMKYTAVLSRYNDGGVIPVACCDEFMAEKHIKTKRETIASYGISVPRKSVRRKLWEKTMSATVRMLLLKTSISSNAYLPGIKLVHRCLADKILFQLHQEGETLADIMSEFLSSELMRCRSHGRGYLIKMVTQLLIHRKRIANGDFQNTWFSELIEAIYETDKMAAIEVLDQGFEVLQYPMVAQQAARLCYLKIHDFERAHEYADKAIELTPMNSYLWDTKGQIYKREMISKFKDKHMVGKEILSAENACDLISLAFKAAESFRKSQMVAESEGDDNYASYFNEVDTTFQLLHVIEHCVEPFRQLAFGGLDHLIKYLVTDYTPKNLRHCWKEYHPVMKQLKNNIETCLSQIDDMITFCREGSGSEFGNSMSAENRSKRESYIEDYERYFGEFSDHTEILDMAEARRRQVISLGAHRFYKIFEIIREKDGQTKLMEAKNLLMQNQPPSVFDLRVIIFVSFALSTIGESQNVPSVEELYSMAKQLYDKSTYHDLYGLYFMLMFHWSVQGRPRQQLGARGSIKNLCKELHERWESRYRKEESKGYSQFANNKRPSRATQKKKAPTYFFLANGKDLRQFAHISEMHSSSRKIDSGALGDTFWSQSNIRKRFRRLKGTLHDGSSLSYRIPEGDIIYIKLALATERATGQREVTFFLGFSWDGPVAYDVKEINSQSHIRTTSFNQAYPKLAQRQPILFDIDESTDDYAVEIRNLKSQLDDIKKLWAKKQRGTWLSVEEMATVKQRWQLERNYKELQAKYNRGTYEYEDFD